MSCYISQAVALGCADGIGGIKKIYVVGDEDVLNKKYRGDSWLAPNLLELVHQAKSHINYQSPEGLTSVVFVKKKNDKLEVR